MLTVFSVLEAIFAIIGLISMGGLIFVLIVLMIESKDSNAGYYDDGYVDGYRYNPEKDIFERDKERDNR